MQKKREIRPQKKRVLPPFNELLAAIELQKKLWSDPKFIPYASTWLNKRRWEDEITAARSRTMERMNEAMRYLL